MTLVWEVHWYIGALLKTQALQVLRPLGRPPPAVRACGWCGRGDKGKRVGEWAETDPRRLGGLRCGWAWTAAPTERPGSLGLLEHPSKGGRQITSDADDNSARVSIRHQRASGSALCPRVEQTRATETNHGLPPARLLWSPFWPLGLQE